MDQNNLDSFTTSAVHRSLTPESYGRFSKAIERYETERTWITWKYSIPPREYANNPYILSWWTESHDRMLQDWARKYGRGWQHYYSSEGHQYIREIDQEAFEEWKKHDPLCEEYVWYNVIFNFIAARFVQQKFEDLLPDPFTAFCESCSLEFDSRSIEGALLGYSYDRLCNVCIYKAFVTEGAHDVDRELMEWWIPEISRTLERIISQAIVTQPKSEIPLGSPADPSVSAIALLSIRPNLRRVKEEYGSWLGALTATGVIGEEGVRTSRGTRCLAEDGHVCLSFGEKTIDDLLYRAGIEHTREPMYPNSNFRADFEINGTLVEYFGLSGDEEYDRKIVKKRKIAKEYRVELMEIYPKQLLDPKRLINRLRGLVE